MLYHRLYDTELSRKDNIPKIAKNLIAYRYSILDAARDNAKILGHKKGALYPWRTIMGKECSGYYLLQRSEEHTSELQSL